MKISKDTHPFAVKVLVVLDCCWPNAMLLLTSLLVATMDVASIVAKKTITSVNDGLVAVDLIMKELFNFILNAYGQ